MESIKADVAKLKPQDGDTIIVRCSERLSQEQMNALRESLAESFAPHPVVVLDSRMSLGVLQERAVKDIRQVGREGATRDKKGGKVGRGGSDF